MSEAERVRRAITYLAEQGWHTGAYVDENTGAVCLAGAVNRSYGHSPRNDFDQMRTQILYRCAIRDLFPERMPKNCGVTAFNDHDATTRKDVDLVMLRALELAQEA